MLGRSYAVAGTVAVLPWGLLLLAFSLWLAILRHFRAQHLTGDDPPAGTPVEADPDDAATGAGRPAPPAASGPPLDDPVLDDDPPAETAAQTADPADTAPDDDTAADPAETESAYRS